MPRKDPVKPTVAQYVFDRDGGCVAPLVDTGCGPCRSRWGAVHQRTFRGMLTLDHVRNEAMMGKRAPSTPDNLVTLCYGHHIATTGGGSQWATAHRNELREYLRSARKP